jgi:manganese-dependent inorganic pyrophosphatase
MDIDGFASMKSEMLDYMNKKVKDEGFNFILLLLTDILKGGSQIFAAGPNKEIVSNAFNVTLVEDSAYAPGLLSRKKQVIPPLTTAIESLND